MITFKSPEDFRTLNTHDPAYPVVMKLVDVLINAYTWEGHPYLPAMFHPLLQRWQ